MMYIYIVVVAEGGCGASGRLPVPAPGAGGPQRQVDAQPTHERVLPAEGGRCRSKVSISQWTTTVIRGGQFNRQGPLNDQGPRGREWGRCHGPDLPPSFNPLEVVYHQLNGSQSVMSLPAHSPMFCQ